MEITKEMLEKAAKDLNEVIDFDIPIKIEGLDEEKLKEEIVSASNLIEATDNISNETVELLQEMGIVVPGHDPKPAGKEDKVEESVVEETEENIELTLEEEAEELTGDDPDVVIEDEKIPDTVKGETVTQEKTEKVKVDKGKTERAVKKGATKAKYTRAQAFCDALQGEPKTLEEIAKKAMKFHIKENLNKKQPQLASVIWAVNDYLQPLIILNFVDKKDKKYFLK